MLTLITDGEDRLIQGPSVFSVITASAKVLATRRIYMSLNNVTSPIRLSILFAPNVRLTGFLNFLVRNSYDYKDQPYRNVSSDHGIFPKDI